MKAFRRIKTLRYAFMLFFLTISFQLMAQSNLREGYVITLQGDTLYGDIDFRTASMNMKRCVFRQNGQSEFKTYLPGEITGYRFTKSGIYYISKQVDIDDDKKLIFVEYVLHGSMNLYQIGESEMLLEDEEGKQAKFSVLTAQRSTDKTEIRHEIKDALIMLNKSYKATNILVNEDKNRENTKKAVKAYVDDVCPDGFCESFEYKSKETPKEDRIAHFWVKAGLKSTQYKFEDSTESGVVPQFSVGLDSHLDRFLKGLMLNVSVVYDPGRLSSSVDVDEIMNNATDYVSGAYNDSIRLSQLDIKVGPGYQFKAGPFMASVKGGFIYRLASANIKYRNCHYYCRPSDFRPNENPMYKKITKNELDFKYTLQYGLYGGIGIEYPLKKISLVCDLEYIYDYNRIDEYAKKHVMTQHAFCLSLGIKY